MLLYRIHMGLLLSVFQALGAEFMCIRLVRMSPFHQGLALGEGFLVGMLVSAAAVMVSWRMVAAWSRLVSVGRLYKCFPVSALLVDWITRWT